MKILIKFFDTLCMEYYFNISDFGLNKNLNSNYPNLLLKGKIKNYLLKMSLKLPIDQNKYNEWLLCYFDGFMKFKNNEMLSYNEYLSNYNITKYNEENSPFNKILYTFNCNIYDILLFFSKNSICFNNEGFPLEKYFEIIQKKMENILDNKKQKDVNYYRDINNYSYNTNNNNKILKNEKNLEVLYLFEIMNNIYDYYINNNDILLNHFKKYFISSTIHITMRKLIDEYINLDKFFFMKNINDNLTEQKLILPEISLLIKYSFKYIDFCLILFLKENNKSDLFEFWSKSQNELYKFYCDYKILSIEKTYNKKDYKEMFSLIAYLTDSIDCFSQNSKNRNKSLCVLMNKNIFFINNNELNRYLIKDRLDDFIDLSINEEENQNYNINYNKIVVLYFEIVNKKLVILDIIDINELKDKKKPYKLKIGKEIKEIFLFLLKNVPTSLYYLDNSILKLLKCNNTPKYSWNISFRQKKFLLVSEEDNKIYNIENENLFNKLEVNEINNINRNLKTFPFYLNKNGEVLFREENKSQYIWLNKLINNNNQETPFQMPIKINIKLKIKIISANLKNSYIIDENGNLYGIGDNTYHQINEENINELKQWTNIPLPDNNKKFLNCSNGKDYLLCLIEDNKGKGKIYLKGNNENYQCGIKDKQLILSFTQPSFKEDLDLDFNLICVDEYFSSAITNKGELYIWGTLNLRTLGYYGSNEKTIINIPTLVNKEDDIVIDNISINSKNEEYSVLIIGKKLERGIYYKRLFYLEKTHSLFSKIYHFILHEIKLINNNIDSRLKPLKICNGDSRAYILCLEEDELIKEINNRKFCEDNEQNLANLRDFYLSKNSEIFIDLLKTCLSNEDISRFVEVIHKIKKEGINILDDCIFNSEYNKYIKEKKGMNKLFLSIEKNGIYKSLFKYLKARILLIEKQFWKYFYTNLLSKYKEFLNSIISNNTLYSFEEDRIKMFYEQLNLRRYDNYKTIEVNRIKKAANFKEKYNKNPKNVLDSELKETIFGQVFQSLKDLNGERFYIRKNGRLFTVALIGEPATDMGGPYHEIISEMCEDLQIGYIDLFIKTPNNKNDVGNLIDKYIINPDCKKEIHKKAYEFIGKLMITAISSGEAFNLNLHPIFWKSILENELTFNDIKTIDVTIFNLINNLEKALETNDKEFIHNLNLKFIITNSNSSMIELIPNGKEIIVDFDKAKQYIKLVKLYKINEFKSQIEYIKKGFYSVIPKDIAKILNYKQLEEMICGKNELDIKELKNHTQYKPELYKDSEIIRWFWKWFEELREEDKVKYLKFVSGRTRLPLPGFNLDYKHTIFITNTTNLLPHSQTCYFQLDLPNYDNYDIFVDKIQYAIMNCADIADS